MKKCAVHLISFKDMMQEQDSAASPRLSNDIHNPYLELSEALDEAGVLKRKPYETEFLLKEQPNPKRIKFLPVPLARKQRSKLHQPNVTREGKLLAGIYKYMSTDPYILIASSSMILIFEQVKQNLRKTSKSLSDKIYYDRK